MRKTIYIENVMVSDLVPGQVGSHTDPCENMRSLQDIYKNRNI